MVQRPGHSQRPHPLKPQQRHPRCLRPYSNTISYPGQGNLPMRKPVGKTRLAAQIMEAEACWCSFPQAEATSAGPQRGSQDHQRQGRLQQTSGGQSSRQHRKFRGGRGRQPWLAGQWQRLKQHNPNPAPDAAGSRMGLHSAESQGCGVPWWEKTRTRSGAEHGLEGQKLRTLGEGWDRAQ